VKWICFQEENVEPTRQSFSKASSKERSRRRGEMPQSRFDRLKITNKS